MSILGDNNTHEGETTFYSNSYFLFGPLVATKVGLVKSISVYIMDSDNSKARFAIYGNTIFNGKPDLLEVDLPHIDYPDQLLGYTEEKAIVVGWNTLNIETPFKLIKDQKYWIGVKTKSNNEDFMTVAPRGYIDTGSYTLWTIQYPAFSSIILDISYPSPEFPNINNANSTAYLSLEENITLSAYITYDTITSSTILTSTREAIKLLLDADAWVQANITTVENSIRSDAFLDSIQRLAFANSELPGIQIGIGNPENQLIAKSSHFTIVPAQLYLVNEFNTISAGFTWFDEAIEQINELMISQYSTENDFMGLGGLCESVTHNISYQETPEKSFVFIAIITINIKILVNY